MSAENTKPNKRSRHPERICLEPKNLERIDGWIQALMSGSAGVRVTRKDLVNWLIETKAETLAKDEQKDLNARFYDDVRYIEQLLKEAKAARARGETVQAEKLKLPVRSSTAPRRPRKQKIDAASDALTNETSLKNGDL